MWFLNKYVIGAALIAIISGAVYMKVDSLNNIIDENKIAIERLYANNAKKEVEINQLMAGINKSNETVEKLQQDYAIIVKMNSDLNDEFTLFRMYGDEVNTRLSAHDLNRLALAKPEMVEKIINNASTNALECFVVLSGGVKKNAKNSECPWLFE